MGQIYTVLYIKIKRNADWLLAVHKQPIIALYNELRVRKQPIIKLYFEFETVLKFITSGPAAGENLEIHILSVMVCMDASDKQSRY